MAGPHMHACIERHEIRRISPPQDKEVQRRFVDTSDSRNRSVEQNIPPVQTAVYKLAKAGSELEQGNPKAAAETLSASASWVAAFTAAGRKLATTPETTDKLDVIVSGIQRAAAAADGGDLAAAKVGYVAAVEAVESWVVDLGIASQIKGL